MTSDFAPEVAKCPRNPQTAQIGDLDKITQPDWYVQKCVRAYCLALLSIGATCYLRHVIPL